MTEKRPPGLIVLGRLVAPHGVQGWFRVHAFGDDPASWKKLKVWRVSPDADAAPQHWRDVRLEDLHIGGKRIVAKLEGVDDRSAAEALSGSYFGAERSALPKLKKGEYYWDDLIGLRVVNEQDEVLGEVVSLVETGANPVLVVQQGETERMLPFVEAVLRKVDVAGGSIRVDWGRDW